MSKASSSVVKESTITWKIKNFSYEWRDLKSPPVTSPCFNNAIFYLLMDQRGSQNDKQIVISIATNSQDISALDYEMALVTADGSPEELSKEENFKFKANYYPAFKPAWVKEILVIPSKTIFEERRDAFLLYDTLTIRCRLQQREVEIPASEENLVSSYIGVRRKFFIWTLKEFSSSWTDIYANLFTIEGTYGRLRLKTSIKEGYIVIEVLREKGDKIYSTLKVSLLNDQKTAIETVNDAFFFEKSEGEQVWQLPPLFSKKELLESKSQLLPNDTLSLRCEFATSMGLVSESEIYSCPREFVSTLKYFEILFSKCKENGKRPSESLQRDLKCMLDTGSLSDFELKVDTDVFPVHKAILGARSPTFNAMFTNDYKETCSGHALISDINANSIRQFLTYLYTDTIENLTIENASELYFASDKYGVLSLREICASFLKANLSSTSACAVLLLADRHQDEELKSAVQDFINKHDFEILRSEDWRDLEKSNHFLALETLRELCLKKSTK